MHFFWVGFHEEEEEKSEIWAKQTCCMCVNVNSFHTIITLILYSEELSIVKSVCEFVHGHINDSCVCLCTYACTKYVLL